MLLVVVILLNSEVVNLVHRTTLPASRNLVNGRSHPVDLVRSSRGSSATHVTVLVVRVDNDGVLHGSLARSIQRLVVENLHSSSQTKQFQTLQTSGLVKIVRNLSIGGSSSNQSLGSLNVSKSVSSSRLLSSLSNLVRSHLLATNSSSREGAHGQATNLSGLAQESRSNGEHFRSIKCRSRCCRRQLSTRHGLSDGDILFCPIIRPGLAGKKWHHRRGWRSLIILPDRSNTRGVQLLLIWDLYPMNVNTSEVGPLIF